MPPVPCLWGENVQIIVPAHTSDPPKNGTRCQLTQFYPTHKFKVKYPVWDLADKISASCIYSWLVKEVKLWTQQRACVLHLGLTLVSSFLQEILGLFPNSTVYEGRFVKPALDVSILKLIIKARSAAHLLSTSREYSQSVFPQKKPHMTLQMLLLLGGISWKPAEEDALLND